MVNINDKNKNSILDFDLDILKEVERILENSDEYRELTRLQEENKDNNMYIPLTAVFDYKNMSEDDINTQRKMRLLLGKTPFNPFKKVKL